MNQRRGRRWSAARGFLRPVLSRPNLRVETGLHVERLEVAGGRVTGVLMTRGGERLRAGVAGEAVLSAGAVGSPVLLEASGIGDGERLVRAGIEVVAHRPGVGENLQDHLQIRPVYRVTGVRSLNTDYANLARRAWMGVEYALFRTGPLTMAPSQLGAFARSSRDYGSANLEFHFQPLSLDKWGDGLHRFGAFTASVCNLRPSSRGSVHRRPDGKPAIQPNYLTTDEDRRVAVDALKLARRIVSRPALARYGPVEHLPGPAVASEAEMLEAAALLGTTIFHPAGTAAMGRDTDPMAALAERLRVRGVGGLRVIDASAMPRITSGNTAAPTMMIAEKGAGMMREERRG